MAKAKYTRQSNGYFQTRVWDGTYKDGKKHYKMLRTSKSSRDLEMMVAEYREAIERRAYTRKSDVSFYDYAVAWCKQYKADATKNTQAMYQNAIHKHLNEVLCPIGSVNRSHYITAINNVSGARTKQIIQLTFKQVMKSALRDKLISQDAFDDIFEDTIKVRYTSPEKRALLPHEKEAVKRANLAPKDKLFLYLIYGCGLRRGEALALTRFDINLSRKVVTINKAVGFDVNASYGKDTKNYKHREVPIPPETFEVVQAYLATSGDVRLFTTRDGKPMSKSSYDKMWARILNALNNASNVPISGLTAHVFRHNYCATLCGQIPALSINKIAELLGDSKKMVVDVYNHDVLGKEHPEEIVSKALAL